MADDGLEIENLDRLLQQLEALAGLPDGAAMEKALLAGGEIVAKAARRNVLARGLVRTRELHDSIGATAVNEKNVVIGTPLGWRARIHEMGGVVSAKRAPFLMFPIGGAWKKVKQVSIPARPFLRPALVDNVGAVLEAVAEELLEEMRKEV